MDAVDARIAQLHARNPYALRLAILSAFAVRLEPHLLRALRRAFEPHSDPSAELDLWHSTLVGSRGASAALLEVEALARLRAALSQDPQRDSAYRRTLECLEGYPPLHLFEVELNALPVLDPAVGDAAIDSHFAPILTDLRLGGEGALQAARWLLQAAPRWHPRVRDTAAAWAALLASSALLEGRRLIPDDPPRNLPADALARALPASLSATRQIGIVLTRERLRFLPADIPDVAHVNVPAMSPALMVLERGDGSQTQVINAEPGTETATGGANVVILRSLTGETWRVEREQKPSAELSHRERVEAEAATRRAAARNAATPPDALAALARDPDANVRGAAARNAATPLDALAELARDPDANVRRAVAENDATPPDALAALARDPVAEVRGAAEANRAFAELERIEVERREASRAAGVGILSEGARQDMLRRDFRAAADRIARAVELDDPDIAKQFAALRRKWEEHYVEGRDKGLNASLEVAIELARLELEAAHDADQRGMAGNDLGVSLWALGERESGAARLEEAVAAYRVALEEQTRERVPLDWAATQSNLGNALRTLGERESGTARLEEAVAAYRAALEEQTRERVPLDWAATQNNLGLALSGLGERESGTARLEEAVAAYRAALEEQTRERVPLDWAATQNNLGLALSGLGEREGGTARLEEAVAAYRAALEEQTRERVPLDWAATQSNLGNALQVLGERESGTARLEEAVAAYRAALEEQTRERVPLDWAATQSNLGNALQVLGERESGTARLEEAVAAYRAALEEQTRERVPLDWAATQSNLGNALQVLGERESGTARLEEAVAAYRAALEEQTRERVPRQWAYTQQGLAKTLAELSKRQIGTAPAEPQRGEPPRGPLLDGQDQEQQAIEAALRAAAREGPDRLRAALARFDKNPSADVKVVSSRGPAMVSVSEGGLPDFESDRSLKSYTTSNHIFADLFGGARVRWPIVFFLSDRNPQGAHLQTVENAASIISLGRPYSLMDASLAIDGALAQQDIRLVRPWFLRTLARESGVDASKAYSLRGLVALPGQVVGFLADHQLRGLRTLLIHDDEVRTLDPEAIAQALGFSSGEYAVLTSDARQTFQLMRNGVQEFGFRRPAGPVRLA